MVWNVILDNKRLRDTVASATPVETGVLTLFHFVYQLVVTLTSNSTWSGYGWSMNGVSGTNPGTWNNILLEQ